MITITNTMNLVLESNIFVHNISKFLYSEEIQNVYSSNKTSRDLIDANHNYIYTKVCLHHQPHGQTVNQDGSMVWYKEGKIHRDKDLPAKILLNGTQLWYKEGKQHRDGDQPAMISGNMLAQSWYKEGKHHRDGDQPSYVCGNTSVWYREGEKHREGDKTAFVISNIIQVWYKNGLCHRDGNLPAIISITGEQEWWIDGVRKFI